MEPTQKIIIARSGSKLGSFSAEHVQDGLRSGLFRPSDHYWKNGSTSWGTLSALFPGIGSEPMPAAAPASQPKPRSFGGCLLKSVGAAVLVLALAFLSYAGYELLSRKSDEEKKRGEELYSQAVKAAPGLAIASPKQSDIPAALSYLRAAAEKGHPVAQQDLGSVLGGWGESQGPWINFKESEKWLTRAAKQGKPVAMMYLTSGYCSDNPRFGYNPSLGLTWHFCLPENQRMRSINALINSGRFDPETIAEARRRASTFIPKSEYRREYYEQMAERGREDSGKSR